jgi:hypothetical protein
LGDVIDILRVDLVLLCFFRQRMATATPPVAVPPLPGLPTATAADDETMARLLKTGKTFAAGMFAGVCECIVGHPLDTLKVIINLKNTHTTCKGSNTP